MLALVTVPEAMSPPTIVASTMFADVTVPEAMSEPVIVPSAMFVEVTVPVAMSPPTIVASAIMVDVIVPTSDRRTTPPSTDHFDVPSEISRRQPYGAAILTDAAPLIVSAPARVT